MFKVCIKLFNIYSVVINLKVRGIDIIGSVIFCICKRWIDLDGFIYLYYLGSLKLNEKLNEEMMFVDVGL